VAVDEIGHLLAANRRFAEGRARADEAPPRLGLAVVTCMDARIDTFAALGLQVGEAHVLRNAGGRVTDDVLRSLALSSNVLGVHTVAVVEHTRCGLAGVTDEDLRDQTGASMAFLPIADHEASLREDVAVLAATPFLEPITTIAGLLYDVGTGELSEVVRWTRPS